MIRVFRVGPHSHRMPISYPALAPLLVGRIAAVADPEAADLFVFAHVQDIENMPRAVIDAWRRRERPVVILSEEPFWDTIWGLRPLDRHILVETRWGGVPVVQVNHTTSALFHFDRIPYYLLTNHRFAANYGNRFPKLAQRGLHAWRDHFATRPMDVSFLFERRPERFHDAAWPAAELVGLSAWRTDLALACQTGRVERLGQSWQGGPTRFELKNWYLDKMVRLDGRARMLGAVENTHHPEYLTEKLFDAFACGARPLYWASPNHRVHDLGLPAYSWVNLHGLTAAEAADRIATLIEDDGFFDAWHDALTVLANLFGNIDTLVAERARLARALHQELEQVLADT